MDEIPMNTRDLECENKELKSRLAALEAELLHIKEVSEPVLHEGAPLKSEELSRSLFDNMLNGFLYCRLINDDGGRPVDFLVLGVNKAFEKQTGLKDAVGKKVSEVVPGILETDRKLFEICGRVAQTGNPERFEIHVEAFKMWLMVSAYSPQKGDFVAIFDVVDVQKQIQESLRRERDFAESLINTAQAIVLVLDPNGKTLTFNKYMEELSGYTLREVRGKDWFDTFLPERSRDEMRGVFSKAIKSERNGGNESWIVVRDGRELLIEWYDKPLKNAAGNILGLLAIGRDITERVKSEKEKNGLRDQLQQAQKMEAVGRLAGGIAHDFNNLLTGILGNVSLALMDTSPEDPLAELLTEVSKAAESAATLTRQLLVFSRKQLIEPKALNLNEIIDRLQKMLIRLIGEDVELKVVRDGGLGTVKTDPGQLEHVLVNLAVNARDAMPEGGRLVIETANVELDGDYCTLHPDARPGRFVMLAVSDNGTGMTDQVKSHIFEPFFTTKTRERGTGLGLAMVYGAVKQAGGSIEVNSEVGTGTTFKLYLPRVDEAPESAGLEGCESKLPGGGETILLVEDEVLVRDMTLKLLKRLGYKTLNASNGIDALGIVREHVGGIDLLMTDVVMPKMNGRELAEKLSGRHPEIKVLFTSGYTEDIILRHGIVEAKLNFISKPFTPRALANKIREILG